MINDLIIREQDKYFIKIEKPMVSVLHLDYTFFSKHRLLEATCKSSYFLKRIANFGLYFQPASPLYLLFIFQNVLPMSGSPLIGLLRGTASSKEKWILTGFLMYGSSYPGYKKAFQGNNVAYHKASLFVDWIHSTLKKSKSI